jgi:hypothetical protein
VEHELDTTDLATLQSVDCFQTTIPQIFPSLGAVRWFMRTHRTELIGNGALVIISRRVLIDPEKFQQVVYRVGTRKAGTT